MTTGSSRVYRSRGPIFWVLGVGLLTELISGLRALNPATRYPALWAATMVMIGLVVLRFVVLRLTAEDRGIHVINFFRSYRLSWNEIERFDIGTVGLLRGVCRIYMVDGKRRSANIVAENSNFRNGSAQRMVDELNAELARRVGHREPTSTP